MFGEPLQGLPDRVRTATGDGLLLGNALKVKCATAASTEESLSTMRIMASEIELLGMAMLLDSLRLESGTRAG